jgi:hypothetical protein
LPPKRGLLISAEKTSNEPSSRRRILRKWTLYGLITLVLLALLGFFLATRSFVLEAIARPQIEATLGGDVEIGSIRWLSFDQLEVSELVGHAPGWDGPASEVIRIDRAILDIDSNALRSGLFNVTSVKVMGMRIRLAERTENPGIFNFESLRPVASDGDIGVPPSKINVVDFEMEMGLSSNGNWTRTGVVDFSGTLEADKDNPRILFFQFLTGSMAETKAVMKGSFDTTEMNFKGAISDLKVNQNLIGMLPLELRKATDSMNLEGNVERITASWDGKDSISASIDLGTATMIVPEKLESSWSRLNAGLITPVTELPLFQIESGRLELLKNKIMLTEFTGRVSDQNAGADSIPMTVDFEMDLSEGLNAINQWDDPRSALESAFEIAPFWLEIKVPDFRIDPSNNGVVLPTAAARAFSEFGIESWLVNIDIDMTRGAPSYSDSSERDILAAELFTSGTVKVEDGIGRYSRFPYPMEDVKALITFTDELVEIEYLIGRGISGGSVLVKGSITKPGPAAGIVVNIKGTDVPGDKIFRNALDGWRRRIWDRFFDMHAENQMSGRGLLNTQVDVEKAFDERTILYERLGELPKQWNEKHEQIIQRILRMDRIIEAGPFEMGGLFSFNLTVSSEEGEGKPVFLTGDIDILEGDVLISDFPFPLHLLNSRITLEPDDILLNSGLTFTTPDGGSGIIRGSIHNPDTEKGQDPQAFIDVEFSARDISISPQLLAALPPSASDSPVDPGAWPGRWQSQAARAMSALGLQGRINLDGTLLGDQDDLESDPILEFTTNWESGTIRPDPEMSDFFSELGFIWPSGFQLESCEATVYFDSEKVEMSSFHGERGQGSVDARGYISRQDDAASLEVSFVTMEMEEYLLDFIPSEPRVGVQEIWSKFKPRGNFDADINWQQNAVGMSDSVVVVEPESITVELEGEDVDVHRRSGRIYIRPNLITVEELETEFRNNRMIHGLMSLTGSYEQQKQENRLGLTGKVTTGRFDSPVIPVILDLVGAARARETWLELEAAGEFDCAFEYRTLQEDSLDYIVDITPRSLSATLPNGQIHANFLNGGVLIAPGRFDLKDLKASIPGPGIMSVKGVVMSGEWIDLDTTVEYEFESFPIGNVAYFPPPMANGLKAIDFESAGPITSNTTSISGRWHPEESIDLPRRYDYSGEIFFENARMSAGIELEEFHGNCVLKSSSSMDEELARLTTTLEGTLEGDTLQIQNRIISNPYTRLNIDDQNLFTANDISGEIADGRMLGDLQIDLGSNEWLLSMDIEDAKLEELTKNVNDQMGSGTFGELRTSFKLAGVIDEADSKFGRGRVVIKDGKMTDSPLTLSILQLSQLMLPISDSFEYGEIDFSIEADKLYVDDLILTSPSIQFTGKGEMSLNDWEIALRLFPKGTIPLFSDLISGVTGTLYAINVKGTLDAPVANLEPLPLLGDPARIKNNAKPSNSTIDSQDQDTTSE